MGGEREEAASLEARVRAIPLSVGRSAWRRRQRRSRSMGRFVAQSVRVAPATASHHSFDSSAGGSTLRTVHRSSGSRQLVNVVESSDEVADTKLPRGVRPEALVSATEPLAFGAVGMSQVVEMWLQFQRLTLVGSSLALKWLQKAFSLGFCWILRGSREVGT